MPGSKRIRKILSSELGDIETHLRKITKMGIVLVRVFAVALLLELTLVAGSLFVVASSLTQPTGQQVDSVPVWIAAVPDLVVKIVGAYALFICLRFSRDIAQGHTPFSEIQAKRFFLASMAFLLSVVVDLLWGPLMGNISFVYDDGFVDFSMQPDDSLFLPRISIGNLIACAVLLLFSLVLKYGAVLQELSDDTV